jgi:hypothetical protein
MGSRREHGESDEDNNGAAAQEDERDDPFASARGELARNEPSAENRTRTTPATKVLSSKP